MKHLCAAIILIVALVNPAFSRAEVYKQVRIANPGEATIFKILQIGLEPIYARSGQYVDFAVSEQDLPRLDSLSIPYTVIHDDMSAFYQSRNPLGLTMGGYRTFDEMVAVMDSFATAYPDFCTPKFSIATTEQGRSLWVMKVSDNPNLDEDEPEAFVSGIIHAREPIGGEIILEFMRFLLTQYGSDPVATNLIDNYQLYFLPVCNPDGYEYNRQIAPSGGGMWRKNRRNNWDGTYGVDLNRNFSYFWGYDDVGSSPNTNDETYRGPVYASEPEAMGIINFVNAHDFAIVLNYHAFGDDFLYPWGYFNTECEDHTYYDTLAAYAQGIGYAVGTPWELLYNTNGDIADWSYGEDRLHRRCFGEVIEVGTGSDGFWPQPNRIAPLVDENMGLLKDLMPRALDAYKRRLPQMPVVTFPSTVAPGTQFYLYWQRSDVDTFNLANSYRVTMLTDRSLVYQDFESTSGYTLRGFTRNNSNHHSGSYSAYSGQGTNLRRYVTLDERLKVQPGEALTFWTLYNIQTGYDYAYVQVSSDGGETWWELNGNLSTSENPHRHNKGYGITGSSSGNWVLGNYPLSNYVGHEIKVRFAYWTDGSVSNEGIYIDDVYPCDTFGSTTVLAENVSAESLLVGPYPIGLRWFKVEPIDDRGQMGPPSDRFEVEIQGNLCSLAGHVDLADSPADLSGSIINIPGAGEVDTTDTAGNYNFVAVPEWTYDIIASHQGYIPDTTFSFAIGSDTTLNFTLELAPLEPPTLLSPDDGYVSHSAIVNFDWSDVGDSLVYLFELARDRQFTEMVIIDSSVTVSQYTNGDPLEDVEYYWRVKAGDGAEWTLFSDTRSFIVEIDTTFMPGDVNNSGYLNGMDVVFLVNYLKGRGPAPSPFLAADANGSCNVNGLDAVYLVNFFKGGPYPLRGDCRGQP
jgi:hypothetical protein